MLLTASILLLSAAADDVAVHARMADGPVEPGTAHAFTVELVVPEGTSASDAGLSAPFLQLDVPDGVTLAEPPTNEQFIGVPYERLMEGPSVEIPFEVDGGLAADATIGVVVTAYLSDASSSRFLRERLELPVRAGARARDGDDADSSWGADDGLLRIGDVLEPFALPLAPEAEPFDLGAVIGERPVFITTYRAHW